MANDKKYKYALILDDLRLSLFLGVTAQERSNQQPVKVTIKIHFARLPRACKSGKISEAICYATLIQTIKKFCQHKEFTLIETLGMQLFLVIKQNLFKGCKLSLSVAKQRPLPELAQSIFEISD